MNADSKYKLNQPEEKDMSQNKEKVVIVGGGIAGLSAGIYALMSGFDAEIFEKNAVPGGECMGWSRKGYHIDNCIHWLTGTDRNTGLWKVWKAVGAIDENTEYADTSKFYSSRVGDKEVTLWNDLDRTERELVESCPEDEAEIRKFIEYVRYAECCTIPSIKPMDMMGIRDYIEMGKGMAEMPKVMKEYGKISCRDLGMRFKNPALRKMMTDYLPADYTAYSLLVSYATMTSGNGKIPMKGSLAMSVRIADRFKKLGGVLHTSASVKSIVINRGKAEEKTPAKPAENAAGAEPQDADVLHQHGKQDDRGDEHRRLGVERAIDGEVPPGDVPESGNIECIHIV